MKLVSLFTGAGGLDSGFVSVNQYETVLANEILKIPAQTYINNFQDLRMLNESIENLDFNLIESEDVDLVIGGPPCQDFSILQALIVLSVILGPPKLCGKICSTVKSFFDPQ